MENPVVVSPAVIHEQILKNRCTGTNIVWHYTYSSSIEAILRAGVLLPPILVPTIKATESPEATDEMRRSKNYQSDAKMLLFSPNPVWEPASYRGFLNYKTGVVTDIHSRDYYAKLGIQIFRIGVGCRKLKPWMRLKQLARMPKDMAQTFEKITRGLGSNYFSWYGSVFPVSVKHWEALENLLGDEWQPLCSIDNL